ncbi:MAG: hypothetical protein CUR34_11940 [Sediminibacterium sp.]|nr:MAG: hypothetical protein CUR34_11940 [Sediminibacterium sp.] [Sediminibacterium sp. FEMGT703S]
MDYCSEKKFSKSDFLIQPISRGEYENCQFDHCDFSNQDLSDCKFIDCVFSDCNLSLVNLKNTALQNVQFIDSKLSGVQFDTCNPFALAVSFKKCIIQHATFFQLRLNKTVFEQSDLTGSDFSAADLTAAVLDHCNLAQVIFERTILDKANLTTAYHFLIDPAVNSINKTRFSLDGLPGLLSRYNIVID